MDASIKERRSAPLPQSGGDALLARMLDLIALVLVFYVLDAILRRSSAIPEAAYFGSTPLLSVFARPWSWVLVVLQCVLWLRFRHLTWTLGETVLGGTHGIRVIAGTIALILAWHFGLYRPNHYFGQAHMLERIVILLGAILTLWRPVYLLLFLLAIHTVSNQFAYPLGGYSDAQPLMLVRCLTGVAAFLLLGRVRPRLDANALIALIFAIIATAYWVNGLQKIRMGWLSLAEPHMLLFSSYTTGWLAGTGEETLSSIGRFLEPWSGVMKVGTILVECSVLVFATRRSLFLLSLAGLIAFHVSVALLTGIVFWMWSAVEIVLIAWVLLKSTTASWNRFARRYALAVVLMTLAGQRLFHPTMLSWFDSRMSYSYRFEAVTGAGGHCVLGPLFFRPYDYQFTVAAMGYLCAEPLLPIVWGATHRLEIARALRTVNDADSALALEADFGSVQFNASKAERMDQFLQNFLVGAAKEQAADSMTLRLPYRLPQLWTLNDASAQCDLSSVRSIDVVQVTSLFDGERYRVLREGTIRSVPIDQVP